MISWADMDVSLLKSMRLGKGFLRDLAIDKGQRVDTTEIVEDALNKHHGHAIESEKHLE